MFDTSRTFQWAVALFLLMMTLGVSPKFILAQNAPVYIDDSPAAVDQLTEAIRLRSQNRLSESAGKYQHILETYRHKLMKTDKPYFTDTRRMVVGQLLGDAPLLEAYRNQYNASAKRLLDQAASSSDRLAALLNVMDRYYLCEWGMVGGLQAAGMLLEEADFASAMAVLEQLAIHPDYPKHVDRYVALVGVCRLLQDQLFESVDLKPIHWVPTEVQLPEMAPVSQIGQAGWALPRLPHDMTELWHISLSNPLTQNEDASSRRRYSRRQQTSPVHSPLDGNLIPLIQADMLFVNDQQGISAFDRLSGRPLWKYQFTRQTSGQGNMANSAMLDQRRSVCVTDDRVVGIVGYMTPWRAAWQLKKHQTHLVCLDRDTGKKLWQTQPKQLDDALDKVFFHGTPLADDRRIYVLMRRSQNSGFHTAYLVALNITDGKLLWKRHLASAAMNNRNRRYALGEMTLYQGQIYVTDNLGTVSAIDGLTGDMLWLYMLGQNPESKTIEPKPVVAAQRSRRTNTTKRPAPIVASDKVLIAPAWVDEPALIIDRKTGNPIGKLDAAGFGPHCQLALTSAGLLSIGSTVELFDRMTFKSIWKQPLEGLVDDEQVQFLVHDDQVMMQIQDDLITLNLQDGSIVNRQPFNQQGVILTANKQWIISRGKELISLMRWEDAYVQLSERIDEHTNEIWPGLALSHIASTRKQWPIVLQGIDAAIAAVNMMMGMPVNSEQQKQINPIFDHVRNLVELPATGDKDPEFASMTLDRLPDHRTMMALFERLAYVSVSPIEEVTGQFARGRYWQYRGQSQSAIEHYQNILADPTLSAVLYQFDQGARQARLEAKLRLIEIVSTDVKTLAAFEMVASEHLHQLLQMNTLNAQSYLSLAESYPRTQASVKARIKAAQYLKQDGALLQAHIQLQQAYEQANTLQIKQQLVGQLAQNYQAQGDLAKVHRVLSNFAMLFPNEPVLRDEQMVKVQSWIKELKQANPKQRQFPVLNQPLGKATEVRGRLLLPTHHQLDVHTKHLLLLRADHPGTLCMYHLDHRKVIWSIPLVDGQTQLLAQSSEQLLLWQPTLGKLVGIHIKTGQQLFEPQNLTHEVQLVADQTNRLEMEPDVQRQWVRMMNPQGLNVVRGKIREAKFDDDLNLRLVVSPQVLIAADGTGRVLAIDRNTGKIIWKRLYALDMLEQLSIRDNRLAIGGRVGLPHDTQSHKLLVVDLHTGDPIMHPLEEKDVLQWIGMVDSDLLISMTEQILTAHRIGTGEVVWRLPTPGKLLQSVQRSSARLPNVMLFKDSHSTFTSLDMTTGQITGSWLSHHSQNSPDPQLKMISDRYFLLTPTQLTHQDLKGNLLWHDAINTTAQFLLNMQMSEDYVVLLSRKDQDWGGNDAPDVNDPLNEVLDIQHQDQPLNHMDVRVFEDDKTGHYHYQILLLERASGRIVHEQDLAPLAMPLLPTATLLCDDHLILTTTTQTFLIPSAPATPGISSSPGNFEAFGTSENVPSEH